MDIFVTVTDARSKKPVTIRVGGISIMQRVAEDPDYDTELGEFTRVDVTDEGVGYVCAVETPEAICQQIATNMAAAQKLIAMVNMEASTARLGEVMQIVRDLMPILRGGRPPEPEAPVRKNCGSCKHKGVPHTENPCVSCRAAGNDYPWWEAE